MAKVFIEESSLTALGNAVREKTGGTDLLSPAEMVTAIGGITTGGGGSGDLPEAAFTLTGNCGYRFANNGWNWFLENYGDKITTSNISNSRYMFDCSTNLYTIPFAINFTSGSTTSVDCAAMFNGCRNLKEIAEINNLLPSSMEKFFSDCYKLRYLPSFNNFNAEKLQASTMTNSYMFNGCYSLRSIPESFLKEIYNSATTYVYTLYYYGFRNCAALDEIRGLAVYRNKALTSNAFNSTFDYCYRVKDIIFDTQEDGTPYAAQWKAQVISLTMGTGSTTAPYDITGYNSGITADKAVSDDASYQALKNDPDWYAVKSAYSRYNHDSAVNTINSLPDTSAYLATAGGTNTIKFTGAAGEKTDGGAINTLTEEEIAVATAKGWTVTFV